MKPATLGVLLRELAMRADEEEEQQAALARDLSMGGVGASKKLAVAAKTISSQRAEIRDLRARLKAVRDTRDDAIARADKLQAELDSLKAQLATEREAHARTLAALSSAADMLEVVSCTELFRRYPQDFQARLRASFISFRAAAKVTP